MSGVFLGADLRDRMPLVLTDWDISSVTNLSKAFKEAQISIETYGSHTEQMVPAI